MGLFGFGKKKDTNEDIKKVVGNVNVNDQKELSRAGEKEKQLDELGKSNQKKMMIDMLRKCSGQIGDTKYYKYSDTLDDVIDNLKSGKVASNERAVLAIDGVLKKYAEELDTYCRQNNLSGILTCVDEIEKLVNQRSNFTLPYYADPKYLSAKFELMQKEVNRELAQQDIKKLGARFEALRADGANASEAEKQIIKKKLLELKSQKEKIQQKIDTADASIGILMTTITQMESNVENAISDDTLTNMEDVLEGAQTVDANLNQATKLAGKIENANKTVRNDGLTVNDVDTTTTVHTETNLDDIEF